MPRNVSFYIAPRLKIYPGTPNQPDLLSAKEGVQVTHRLDGRTGAHQIADCVILRVVGCDPKHIGEAQMWGVNDYLLVMPWLRLLRKNVS